ncbi:hypothetical protein P7K49_006011 [Saguinus oedipus]|uniref:Uncharacterized protein n=1 Tax=Saguinus oedipus TaxID=9490 RepID=A0ABQ9W173_SAGOE|nr:hypothetical protein P7K49_006011 [Saguinus oedipus]
MRIVQGSRGCPEQNQKTRQTGSPRRMSPTEHPQKGRNSFRDMAGLAGKQPQQLTWSRGPEPQGKAARPQSGWARAAAPLAERVPAKSDCTRPAPPLPPGLEASWVPGFTAVKGQLTLAASSLRSACHSRSRGQFGSSGGAVCLACAIAVSICVTFTENTLKQLDSDVVTVRPSLTKTKGQNHSACESRRGQGSPKGADWHAPRSGSSEQDRPSRHRWDGRPRNGKETKSWAHGGLLVGPTLWPRDILGPPPGPVCNASATVRPRQELS